MSHGLPELQVEQFRLLLLDGKHRLVDDLLVSQGTFSVGSGAPPRGLQPRHPGTCRGALLMHNQTSGDPSPSANMLEITRRRELGARACIADVHALFLGLMRPE